MRVDTPPPVYEPIHKPAVKIFITEDKAEYTNGDIIRGCMILKVSDPALRVMRAKVRLSCLETAAYEGPERRTDITHFSCEKNLLVERDFIHEFRYGIHRFPFSFILGPEIAKCPPTVSWQSLEKARSGVHWTIHVWIENSSATIEQLPLRDSEEVCVYPFDREAALALYENAMKLPLVSNLREMEVFYYRALKIEVTGLPMWLSRKPENFNLCLSLVPYEPVHLESVSVYFESYAKFHPQGRTSLISYESQALGCVDYGQLLDPAQPAVTLRLDGCSLDRHHSQALELATMTVSSRLTISIRTATGDLDRRWVEIKCLSPGRLRDELEKEVTAARMRDKGSLPSRSKHLTSPVIDSSGTEAPLPGSSG